MLCKEWGRCNECPYDSDTCITTKGQSLIIQDALDLINRQKAEIERLERIVSIKQKNKQTLKTEAIKEFAERLKKQFDNLEYRAKTKRKTVSVDYLDSQMNWVLHEVSSTIIDNLVKEMAGDENA